MTYAAIKSSGGVSFPTSSTGGSDFGVVDQSLEPTWSYRQAIRDYLRFVEASVDSLPAHLTELGDSLKAQTRFVWDPDDDTLVEDTDLPLIGPFGQLIDWLQEERSQVLGIPSLSWLDDGLVSASWLDSDGGRASVTFGGISSVSWLIHLPGDTGTGLIDISTLDERLICSSTEGVVFARSDARK